MGNNTIGCKHINCRIDDKEETYPVLGENITILASVKTCCDCGREVFDYALDESNLRKAFAKYKRNHSLMTAEEICALRKKYNISQRTLATLIGCSQATIVRYEGGNIQNNTHNNIMRMLQKPENMAEMLEIKEEELSNKEVEAIRSSLMNIESVEFGNNSNYEEFVGFLNIVPNRFSGFKKFDFRKFTEMVRFFASRISGNLYKTKLFKLLWYSDMYFFREYTKSISGMNYVHYPYGPVPKEYSFLLGLMEKIGAIRILEVENQFGSGDVITATSEYESGNCLAEDEIEVLRDVLTKFGEMSAGDISEQSHREKGYVETCDMELISYTYAMDM